MTTTKPKTKSTRKRARSLPRAKVERAKAQIDRKLEGLGSGPPAPAGPPTIGGYEVEVDRLAEIAEQLDALKGEHRALATELRDLAAAHLRVEEETGRFSKTALVKGTAQDVRVTRKDAFSKIGLEHRDVLEEVLGDLYEQLFAEQIDLKLKVSYAVLAKAAQKVGLDLDRYFKRETYISVAEKKGFLERRASLRPELSETQNHALDRVVDAAAYAPSVGFKK